MKIRKILLTTVAALCLMAVTVAGTLAYLVSTTDMVQNTFTVGQIAITLDEARVNTAGQPLNKEGDVVNDVKDAERVVKNTYKLMPGHTYTKDPTIKIDDASEESYLRIVVTVENAKKTDALLWDAAKETLREGVLVGLDLTKWDVVSNEYDETKDTRTYIMNYKDKISGSTANIVIFSEVKVPQEFTNAQISDLSNTKLNIVAHAIQTDGFVDTVVDGKTITAVQNAWAAFDAQKADSDKQ